MQTVTEMAPRLGVALTCAALDLPRATYYRGQRPRPEPKPRPTPVRALPPEDAAAIGAVRACCDADLGHERPGIISRSISGLGREEPKNTRWAS
jgi:hypothetical protein